MRPEDASGRPVGGKDYPRNLAEFEAFFSTERDCLLYLARLRWPEGFRCRFCDHDRYWWRDDGLLCCACRRKTSIAAGTLFDKSQLGLRKWFSVIWYVVNQTGGVSALGLQRVLGFGSYQTAWAWLHKLRRAMEPTSGNLRGEVEVDELFVGGVEAGVTGRETKTKSKVIVAVERRGPRMSAGRVRMRRIERFDGATLVFIEEVVEPGSTVVTDGWGGYAKVGERGYTHVAHNISKSGQQAHELMPAVHRVAALVKGWLLRTHQGAVAPSHLDFYLAEWCFRFNRRRSSHRGLLFHNLVLQAALTPPQPYTDLLSPVVGQRRNPRTRRSASCARRASSETARTCPVPRRRGRVGRELDSMTKPCRRSTMVAGRRGNRSG